MFPTGRIVATPGIVEALSSEEILEALGRHVRGDWGEVDDEDWQANNDSLRNGTRLLSAYLSRGELGKKFWIITEADRNATTLLWPDEY